MLCGNSAFTGSLCRSVEPNCIRRGRTRANRPLLMVGREPRGMGRKGLKTRPAGMERALKERALQAAEKLSWLAHCVRARLQSWRKWLKNNGGFTGCGKTHFGEGYGLQPVHKPCKISGSLGPDGCFSRDFAPKPAFSAACLAPAAMEFSRAPFGECGMATSIAFPTVPEGKAGIRALRNSEQIKTQLDQTLETFERVEMRMGILG